MAFDLNTMKKFFQNLVAPRRSSAESPKIRLGVLARDKKADSKPMREILSRLDALAEFEIVRWNDRLILEAPVEEWPRCDCLLSWHSDGFPLDKAEAYVRLRRPFLINDTAMQDILLDRRKVYRVLQDNSIPVPRHVVVSRDELPPGAADPPGFVEDEDYVEMNGTRIFKPFVEKPVNAEDHNIYIYYPHSMGGGVKRLFRKVDDKSSQYDADHPGAVRRDGSYIYEEFLPTGGTDVKVYTVGPRYAHAEARKSPVVDGKVLRTPDGKEMRFPVLLSPQEKEIARMVALAFGQKICGFDLLRSEKGISFVCDVNGLSLVKNSSKYYDDASGILRSIILSALAPHRVDVLPAQAARRPAGGSDTGGSEVGSGSEAYRELSVPDLSMLAESGALPPGVGVEEALHTDRRSQDEELRCVLAVIRHGDRTPKQKVKVKITAEPLLALFHKYKDSKGHQAKMKSPLALQELLDITRQLLAELDQERAAAAAAAVAAGGERPAGLERQASMQALERQGSSGGSTAAAAAAGTSPSSPAVTSPQPASVQLAAAAGAMAAADADSVNELREKLRIVRTVLEQGGHFAGVNRKAQLKPTKWCVRESDTGEGGGGGGSMSGAGSSVSGSPVLEEAMLILKWGGVLTHAGRRQAEDLGRAFRLVMYPAAGGGGLLRLHSTYRHDLKIYSSDEGRVQLSAAAFTQGLLDLEGSSLTPILVSLVKKDASMLEAFGKGASEDIKASKNILYHALTQQQQQQQQQDGGAGTGRPSTGTTPLVGSTPLMMTPPISPSRRDSGTGLNPGSMLLAGGGGMAAAQHPNGPSSIAPAGSNSIAGSVAAELDPLGSEPPPSEAGDAPPSLLSSAPSFGGGGNSLSLAPPASLLEGVGSIRNMPDNPLAMLMKAVELMRVLVDSLRTLCFREKAATNAAAAAAAAAANAAGAAETAAAPPPPPSSAALPTVFKPYSSLSMDPREWALDPEKPCSGERALLMFDRWQKLLKSFYNEKKGRFDISKVPDIYDSIKHDIVHNSHLDLGGFDLSQLYAVAKPLADVVISNEYGISPRSKLSIGTKICNELIGKLLCDLFSMRDESVATSGMEGCTPFTADGAASYDRIEEVGRVSLQDEEMLTPQRAATATNGGGGRVMGGDPSPVKPPAPADGPDAADDGSEQQQQQQDDESNYSPPEHETIHRLCPTYASDINSPLRHVRTRIYFTSESHIHSLMNTLQFCHLAAAPTPAPAPSVSGADGGSSSDQQQQPPPLQTELSAGSAAGAATAAAASTATTSPPPAAAAAAERSLMTDEAQALLDGTPEFDYLTHLVLRMYECKSKPIDSPERFRIELLFSPGANYNPVELREQVASSHLLPIRPRTHLHAGDGVTLAKVSDLLTPFAFTRKFVPSSYALQFGLKVPVTASGNARAPLSGSAVGIDSGGGGGVEGSSSTGAPHAGGAGSITSGGSDRNPVMSVFSEYNFASLQGSVSSRETSREPVSGEPAFQLQ